MKIGLFFGSFNPVHNGHMAMADYFIQNTGIDQLWFVISPHNPFKNKGTLLPFPLRLKMLELAVETNPLFSICDIEFYMPQPSYTLDTLRGLSKKYPDVKFVLLMGSDGLVGFEKWKDYKQLIQEYHRYIYPRNSQSEFDASQHSNCTFLANAPVIDISSSLIRQQLKDGKDAGNYLPENVSKFINKKFPDDFFKQASSFTNG